MNKYKALEEELPESLVWEMFRVACPRCDMVYEEETDMRGDEYECSCGCKFIAR